MVKSNEDRSAAKKDGDEKLVGGKAATEMSTLSSTITSPTAQFNVGMPTETHIEPGKIILLCGTSTAGKTSICNAAQSEGVKTGHVWILDGADVASEKAWTESSVVGGKSYLGAQEHFVNAMKTYADPSLVDTAVSAFGARTLSVALFSRRNLGNPKVDQVDLTPEADIKAQAIKIYDLLSLENKQKYSPDNIENLLSIIQACPDVDTFFAENPYPPMQQLNEQMLERAITRAKNGESTILDVIGNETLNGQNMVEQFKIRLESAGLPVENGIVAVAHCPVSTLIKRMDDRNTKAIEEDREEDVRHAFFPFSQYGALYERAPDVPDPNRPIIGMVTRQDITNAALKYGNGAEDAALLLHQLGFTDDIESISLVSRVQSDLRFHTESESPEQIAKNLCDKAFANSPNSSVQEMKFGY